jgi:phenylalanyl-tRNA synthetase beta chain
MKFSSQVLSHYIDIPVSVEQLANDLTLKTCEVEEIFERKIPELVVIGKVLDVYKHPNADTLFVTKIDCGSHGVFQICTGGENVTKNSYIPAALPGCHLPVLDMTIGERKMRGEESNGMICSKREIGFNEDEEYHWIWTLQLSKDPEDYAGLSYEWKEKQGEFTIITDDDCGKPLREVFPWMEGFVLDVDNKTLTHRADLFGHFWLAKEIGAIYGTWLHGLVQQTPSAMPYPPYQGEKASLSSSVEITIATPLCSFYGALSGTMKPVDETTAKVKRFIGRVMLTDLGLQPRHDWVNFSNLYMYMTGQPIHVFDADKISGGITVRQANNGELFLDLTGKEHSLSADDIVIADDTKILALAGIYWWLESGVSETTTKVLIEIAHFDPVQVRKTGMRLGIRTDAQQRYEKNMNPLWTKQCFETMRDEWKLDEVLVNILQHATCNMQHEILGWQSTKIYYNLSRCSKLIYGDETSLDEQDFRKILEGLGFQFIWENTVIVPIWRGPADITIEDDLIEEYIRIKGYETIAPKTVTSSLETIELSTEVKQQRFLEQYLLRQGVSQVETYPWASEKQILDFGISLQDCYIIKNPIDTNLPYLRPTMLWSMLGAVVKNTQTFESMKLFDIGKIWKAEKEYTALGIIIVWVASDRKTHPFVELKSLLETFSAHIKSIKKEEISSIFHPLQQAQLVIGEEDVGMIASIHPSILEAQGIKEGTVVSYLELMIDDLDVTITQIRYETNDQQILWKEAGFLFDKTITYDALMQSVRCIDGVLEAKIVDLYIGDRISSDKKSVTVSVKIDATGKDIEYSNEMLWKVIEAVKSVGGEMRS